MRRSPPREAKKRRLSAGGRFFAQDSDSDQNEDGYDVEGMGAENDVILLEIAAWKKFNPDNIEDFKDGDGLLDEYKLTYSVRHQFPLHYSLFKRLAARTCAMRPTLNPPSRFRARFPTPTPKQTHPSCPPWCASTRIRSLVTLRQR